MYCLIKQTTLSRYLIDVVKFCYYIKEVPELIKPHKCCFFIPLSNPRPEMIRLCIQ